jgi:hypothetical protein
MRQFSCICLAIVASTILWAADECPLSVTVGTFPDSVRSSPAGQRYQATIKNVGAHPIAAYALVVYQRDRGGDLVSKVTARSMTAAVTGKGRQAIVPGETLVDSLGALANADVEGGSVDIKVDYVLFENGSSWGPDKTGTATYIQGVRAGAKLK